MNVNDLELGIVGGTGKQGRGLALRWALAGARVIVGSRKAERAGAAADELNRRVGREAVRFGENSEVLATAPVVVLATPFEHAAETLRRAGRALRPGAIVIDVTVPVSFRAGRADYIEPPEGSASEHLRAFVPPSAYLVAAFKTIPARELLDVGRTLDCDVFVASDSEEARAHVIEAAAGIEGLRPLDAGTLDSARTIERMSVLAINLNLRYRAKGARYRLVGVG